MVLWCRKRGLFQPKEGRFLKQPIYNTALYLRLSRDDERTGESVSIENQENICQGGFHPKDEIPPDKLKVLSYEARRTSSR